MESPPCGCGGSFRGLSQSELARASGVNRVQIVDIEADRNSGSVRTLRKLADVLSVTVDDLIPRADDDARPVTAILPGVAPHPKRRGTQRAHRLAPRTSQPPPVQCGSSGFAWMRGHWVSGGEASYPGRLGSPAPGGRPVPDVAGIGRTASVPRKNRGFLPQGLDGGGSRLRGATPAHVRVPFRPPGSWVARSAARHPLQRPLIADGRPVPDRS